MNDKIILKNIRAGLVNWQTTLAGLIGAISVGLEDGTIAQDDFTNVTFWAFLLLGFFARSNTTSTESSTGDKT